MAYRSRRLKARLTYRVCAWQVLVALVIVGVSFSMLSHTHSLPTRIYAAKLGRPVRAAQLFSRMNARAAIYQIGNHANLVLNGYESLRFAPDKVALGDETLVGLIPGFFSRDLNRALVIGAGSGTTAAAAARVYGTATIIDLDPNAPSLLRSFGDRNARVLNAANVRLVQDNALAWLARSRSEYDAIVSTPTVPSYAGANQVYARAFFQQVIHHLAPGGVFTLWFDIRETVGGIRTLWRTFRASFPHTLGYRIAPGYFELIGSNEPIRPRQRSLVGRLNEQQVTYLDGYYRRRRHAGPLGDRPYELFTRVRTATFPTRLMTSRGVVDTGAINTLNHPVLQFATRISTRADQGMNTSALHKTFDWLSRHTGGKPQPALPSRRPVP